MLPTGNVLAGVTNQAHSQFYTFYEYSPTANTFTSVMTGAPTNLGGILLQTPLPDGTVLVAASNSSTLYIYHPQGAQLTSFGQPAITNITGPVAGVYTLTGTTLNGLTNGANRDDEQQNYTSFPMIPVTTPGETEYVRVTSVSTASIAPGTSVTATFTLPGDAPHGPVQIALGQRPPGLEHLVALERHSAGGAGSTVPPLLAVRHRRHARGRSADAALFCESSGRETTGQCCCRLSP